MGYAVRIINNGVAFLIKKIKSYFLENYLGESFIKQKQVTALLYYLLVACVLLPVLIFMVLLFTPDYSVFVVPLVLAVLAVIIACMVLLKKGGYEISAVIITFIVMVALIAGMFYRLINNPATIYAAGFYLLFVVIMQATLFCSRSFVIFCSAVILLADVMFYVTVKDHLGPSDVSAVRLSAIYIFIGTIFISLLSQLLSDMFSSALVKLEEELKVNIENFLRIEDLNRSSKKLQEEFIEVREVSLRDALTGLRNRRFLDEVMLEELEVFVSQKQSIVDAGYDKRDRHLQEYALVFVDIDHFKHVNDRYGHDAGDLVLKGMARIFTESIRKDDIVIRWGGEEFLIILKNTKRGYLHSFAEKVRLRVEEHDFDIGNGRTIRKTCSIGYICVPVSVGRPDSLTMNEYIALADKALYYCKANGRNRWAGVEEGPEGLARDNLAVALRSLDDAVRRKIIKLRTED